MSQPDTDKALAAQERSQETNGAIEVPPWFHGRNSQSAVPMRTSAAVTATTTVMAVPTHARRRRWVFSHTLAHWLIHVSEGTGGVGTSLVEVDGTPLVAGGSTASCGLERAASGIIRSSACTSS